MWCMLYIICYWLWSSMIRPSNVHYNQVCVCHHRWKWIHIYIEKSEESTASSVNDSASSRTWMRSALFLEAGGLRYGSRRVADGPWESCLRVRFWIEVWSNELRKETSITWSSLRAGVVDGIIVDSLGCKKLWYECKNEHPWWSQRFYGVISQDIPEFLLCSSQRKLRDHFPPIRSSRA